MLRNNGGDSRWFNELKVGPEWKRANDNNIRHWSSICATFWLIKRNSATFLCTNQSHSSRTSLSTSSDELEAAVAFPNVAETGKRAESGSWWWVVQWRWMLAKTNKKIKRSHNWVKSFDFQMTTDLALRLKLINTTTLSPQHNTQLSSTVRNTKFQIKLSTSTLRQVKWSLNHRLERAKSDETLSQLLDTKIIITSIKRSIPRHSTQIRRVGSVESKEVQNVEWTRLRWWRGLKQWSKRDLLKERWQERRMQRREHWQ